MGGAAHTALEEGVLGGGEGVAFCIANNDEDADLCMGVYGNPSMSSRVTGSKPRKREEGTALVHITRFPPQSSIFVLVSFFSVGKESEVSALG